MAWLTSLGLTKEISYDETWGELPGMKEDMTGAAAQPAVVAQAQCAGAQPPVTRTPSAASLPDHHSLQPASVSLEPAASLAHLEHAGHHAAAAVRSKSYDGEADSSSHADSSIASGSDDDEEGDAGRLWSDKEALVPEALKAARKAHKAVVKETNRERRKQKMKKHIKKRAVNKHKHK